MSFEQNRVKLETQAPSDEEIKKGDARRKKWILIFTSPLHAESATLEFSWPRIFPW